MVNYFESRQNNRFVPLTGVILFIVLLVLAAFWHKERVGFLDMSYHLFYILKDDSFAIQNNRFGSFFTQLFPLLASKAKLPLETVSILYSVSFIVLYFLTYIILEFVLKNRKLSTAYLLYTALITTHTFFWIQSEFPQCIAFMFLFLGILEKTIKKRKASITDWTLMSILLLTVAFSNPLSVFTVTFILSFYFLYFQGKEDRHIKKMLIVTYAMYIFFMGIRATIFKTAYESSALGGLKHNLFDYFRNIFSATSNRNFIKYLVYDYNVFAIVAITIAIYYFFKKKWFKLLLFTGFTGGFILMVNINYYHGADQFYLENQYLVLAVITSFPLVYDLLYKQIKYSFPVIIIICIMCIVRINYTFPYYNERYNWFRKTITQTEILPDKKIIIPEAQVPKKLLQMTWGSSFEFWYVSTLANGTSRSIIISEKDNEFDFALHKNKLLITKWGVYDYKEFPPQYFNFTDTSYYIKHKGKLAQ